MIVPFITFLGVSSSLICIWFCLGSSAAFTTATSTDSYVFKYSIICAISICIPAIFDVLNDIFLSPIKLYSYKGFISNLTLITIHVSSNAIMMLVACPQRWIELVACVFLLRRIVILCVTYSYLSIYSNRCWNNFWAALSISLLCVGTVIESYNLSRNGTHPDIDFVSNILLVASVSIFTFLGAHMIINNCHCHELESKKSPSESPMDDYCCNCYVMLTNITVILFIVLQSYFNSPDWFSCSGDYLAFYNTLLSLHLVALAAFPGCYARMEASLALVNNSFNNNLSKYIICFLISENFSSEESISTKCIA